MAADKNAVGKTASDDVIREVEELVVNGRRLLAAAVEKLLAKIESGAATAADFNSAARLVDLLGLDRLVDMRDSNQAERLRRSLEELDRDLEREDAEREGFRQ